MTNVIELEVKPFQFQLGSLSNEFTWSHLSSDGEESEAWLKNQNMPRAAKEGLLAEETRPRCELIDDGVLLYLRGINYNHGAEADDMVSLRLWLSHSQVVSTTKHQRNLVTLTEMQKAVENGDTFPSVGNWLCKLLDKLTNKICDEVEQLETQTEKLEDLLEDKPEKIHRTELINIRKECAQIKRFLLPQREALEGLIGLFETLTDIQKFRVKEQSERISRYIDILDVVREKCLVIQDELRHQTAELQANRVYALSIITAIFLPLSFVTGLFGMNVGGLPGIEDAEAFAFIMESMVAFVVVMLIVVKIKKWM